MRKILLCLPEQSAFTIPMRSSLIRLGFDTKIYDYQRGGIVTKGIGIVQNLFSRSIQIRQTLHKSRQDAFLKIAKDWRPDMIIVVKGECLDPKTIFSVMSLGIKTVNWYPDWLIYWEWIKKNAPAYSLFASSCYNTYKRLRQHHIKSIYLPYAANPDPLLYKDLKKYPVVFIGQYTKRREKYFSTIADLGLRIWGYAGWQSSNLREIAYASTTQEQTTKILRTSKIVLNILTGDDDFQPYTVNVRTWETMAVGSFLLAQSHPVYKKHFQIGKDLQVFTSPQDLRSKIIYYLRKADEREHIAKHGWQTVVNFNTYDLRFKELLQLL